MGTFDYLRCKMPLPGLGPPEGTLFQTKDTERQAMEEYTITEDGRLIHHAVAYEVVPKAERPHPEADGLLGLSGSIRRLPKGDVEIPLHGDLEFHYFDKDLGWWSYIARFTEGRCVRIWLQEHRPPASVQTHM